MANSAVETLKAFLDGSSEADPVQNPLVLIPCFENTDFVAQCLKQLAKMGLSHPLLLDGGSESPGMVSLLSDQKLRDKTIILPGNPGPKWFFEDENFYNHLPEVFCVTDPDLVFNKLMPKNFLHVLLSLTEEFKIGKAGLALDIDSGVCDERFFYGDQFLTIRDWEAQFWSAPLVSRSGERVFRADIDTTFALYNKKYFRKDVPNAAVRVAGPFSAKHIPWFPELIAGFDSVSVSSPHSNWLVGNEEKKIERVIYQKNLKIARKNAELELLRNSLSWRITRPLRALNDWFSLISRKR